MKYDPHTVRSWVGNSTWRACRADFARFRLHGYSGWGSEGFWALVLYRIQRMVRQLKPRWCWLPIVIPLAVTKKIFTFLTHIDLNSDAEIGPGLLIPHLGEIRVHADTRIGADCAIHHVCTIGAGPIPGGAVIGDHVFISCHSTILGAVTIGDGAIVAANSLVISNIPAGATAIGVPARILPAMPDGMTSRRGASVSFPTSDTGK